MNLVSGKLYKTKRPIFGRSKTIKFVRSEVIDVDEIVVLLNYDEDTFDFSLLYYDKIISGRFVKLKSKPLTFLENWSNHFVLVSKKAQKS